MFVVMIWFRQYRGGYGYCGPACGKAGEEPGKVYKSMKEACVAAKRFHELTNEYFYVVPWRQYENEDWV